MGQKCIKFEFLSDGTMEAETGGFKGKACEKVLRRLLKDNVKIDEQKHKSEYYQDGEKVEISTEGEGGEW